MAHNGEASFEDDYLNFLSVRKSHGQDTLRADYAREFLDFKGLSFLSAQRIITRSDCSPGGIIFTSDIINLIKATKGFYSRDPHLIANYLGYSDLKGNSPLKNFCDDLRFHPVGQEIPLFDGDKTYSGLYLAHPHHEGLVLEISRYSSNGHGRNSFLMFKGKNNREIYMDELGEALGR